MHRLSPVFVSRRRLIFVVLGAAVLGLAVWGLNAEGIVGRSSEGRAAASCTTKPVATAAGTTSPSGNAAAPAGNAALRVAIDPETGQLGLPTSEQAAALDKANGVPAQDSFAGLHEVVHPDGSAIVDLQGRFMCYSVARLGTDGKLHTDCVQGEAAAGKALHGGAPAATASKAMHGTAHTAARRGVKP